MSHQPILSLIVPTRKRPKKLAVFFDSLKRTVADPKNIELVLVIDEDDQQSRQVSCNNCLVRHVVVPPGRTMGALNMAGYTASSGQYLMLLNDDVVCRTAGWNTKVLKCFRVCPDDVLLVHVNDTLMKTALCTFPIVSRTFCEIAGGICPKEYQRYRIDDHIEDIFNLLGVLGEQRTVYLPNVVFEHQNYEEREQGKKQYFADEKILARDAPIFERLFPFRKQIALALRALVEKNATAEKQILWKRQLEAVTDSFSLRDPQRLRLLESFSRNDLHKLSRRIQFRLPEPTRYPDTTDVIRWKLKRAHECFRQSGLRGLIKLAYHKTIGSHH